MDPTELSQIISRISTMEQCYDRLLHASTLDPETIQRLSEQLRRYYESGLWLQDYELDEQGYLPAHLKRGVLSQDGVFDLLTALQHPES